MTLRSFLPCRDQAWVCPSRSHLSYILSFPAGPPSHPRVETDDDVMTFCFACVALLALALAQLLLSVGAYTVGWVPCWLCLCLGLGLWKAGFCCPHLIIIIIIVTMTGGSGVHPSNMGPRLEYWMRLFHMFLILLVHGGYTDRHRVHVLRIPFPVLTDCSLRSTIVYIVELSHVQAR